MNKHMKETKAENRAASVPVLLRHEVPDISHNSSTDSLASEKDRSPPHCYRCSPISELECTTNDCCAITNMPLLLLCLSVDVSALYA